MRMIRWAVMSLLISSCLFSIFALSRLFRTPEAGTSAMPLGLTPRTALEELRPGGRAAQGLQALLGDEASGLTSALEAAGPSPTRGEPAQDGPIVITDTRSQGGVRVAKRSSAPARTGKGSGAIIDSDGKRYELTEVAKPAAASGLSTPKLLEKLPQLALPLSGPAEAEAPATPARGMRLLGLAATAGLALIIVVLRRYRP